MNNLIIKNSQLITAIVPANPAFGSTCPFQDIPNISKGNIKVYGLEIYSADQITFTPDGLAVIAAGDIANAMLTLVTTEKNNKQIENQPVFDFVKSLNGGFITLLDNIEIDLTKCYITLLATGGFVANQAFVINLYFDYK